MHIELNRAKAVERKRCREASVQMQPLPTDKALPCSGAMQGFHVGPALVTGQFWAAAHRGDSIAQDALSPAAGFCSVTQEREEDPLAEAISAAAEAVELASNCAADARAGLLDPSTEIGAHALRSAARVKALAKPARAGTTRKAWIVQKLKRARTSSLGASLPLSPSVTRYACASIDAVPSERPLGGTV